MKPTHNKGNILDLLFTKNTELIHSYECNESLFSDHYLVDGKINYKSTVCVEEKETDISNKIATTNFDQLNFFSEKIDWKKINEELQKFDWRGEFRGLPPEEMLARFLYNCFFLCEKYIPQKRKSSKSSLSKFHGIGKCLCEIAEEN